MRAKQKLYCYVDETGQDTQGRLFIVVAIIVENDRDKVEVFLEKTEKESDKGKRKWVKSREKEKNTYLNHAFSPVYLKGALFYHLQHNTKAYEAQTVITIEQSIRHYITTPQYY